MSRVLRSFRRVLADESGRGGEGMIELILVVLGGIGGGVVLLVLGLILLVAGKFSKDAVIPKRIFAGVWILLTLPPAAASYYRGDYMSVAQIVGISGLVLSFFYAGFTATKEGARDGAADAPAGARSPAKFALVTATWSIIALVVGTFCFLAFMVLRVILHWLGL